MSVAAKSLTTRARIRAALGAALLVLCGALTACAPPPRDPRHLVVWTLENLEDRLAVQRAAAQKFTDATGITVDTVGVDEDQFNQLVTASAASGTLPDVVGALPLAAVRSLAANELLDRTASGRAVAELGSATFSARALELTRDGPTQLAVPSDAWPQLLYYRKDLFTAAGLAEPRTYADITAAATKLGVGDVAGFVGATTAGDAFTQQTFEHLALANGCQMVDQGGRVALDSPPCVAAFAFYDDLIRNHSVKGAQDVDTTRATYFAGKAAMVVWSSFLLDELAGLRDDAAPSCPQCVGNPRFLADNTGIVPALQGPDAREPAQFGEVQSWAVLADANADAATRFVEFMLSDGYPTFLSSAPEGKFPTRSGTPDRPTQYVDLWRTIPAGVDRKVPLAQIYPPQVLDALAGSVNTIQRWGITQGQGALVGATLGELPVPQAIAAMTSGEVSPAAAARAATADVGELQDSLR
jgi:multiple sugar transport system substrate-binding protein